MVLFLDPHSRKDVKAMRQKYMPGSNKSSRRLYAQALKLRKHYSHLFSGKPFKACLQSLYSLLKSFLKTLSEAFYVLWKAISGFSVSLTARIDLEPNTNMWYDILKDKIRQQQSKPVWVSEVAVRALEFYNDTLTSCRINAITSFVFAELFGNSKLYESSSLTIGTSCKKTTAMKQISAIILTRREFRIGGEPTCHTWIG